MRAISSSDGTSRFSKLRCGLRMPLLTAIERRRSDVIAQCGGPTRCALAHSTPDAQLPALRRAPPEHRSTRTCCGRSARTACGVQTKQGEDALAVAGRADALPDGARRGGHHRALDQGFVRQGDRRAVRVHQRRPDAGRARGVRLRLVGRRGRPRRRRPRAGCSPATSGRAPTATRSTTSHRPRRRRPGLRPAAAPDPEAARPAAGPHGADEPVDPAGQPPRRAGVKSRNTIAPCHGWIHALVFGDKLHLVHNQRSGDTPIGVPVQHGPVHGARADDRAAHRATSSSSTCTGSSTRTSTPTSSTPSTRCSRASRAALPTLALTEAGRAITDIHDFRAEHFELTDYDPHPGIRGIPVLDVIACVVAHSAQRRDRPRRRAAVAPADRPAALPRAHHGRHGA